VFFLYGVFLCFLPPHFGFQVPEKRRHGFHSCRRCHTTASDAGVERAGDGCGTKCMDSPLVEMMQGIIDIFYVKYDEQSMNYDSSSYNCLYFCHTTNKGVSQKAKTMIPS
jgi:hypothetical protein